MKGTRRSNDEEYVFVVTSTRETCTSDSSIGSVEELPTSLPFLPLDSSTEITKHEGYDEAILVAQRFLDSRLGSFSHFLEMIPPKDSAEVALVNAQRKRRVSEGLLQENKKPLSIGIGWGKVKEVDEPTRLLLRDLEEEGILYVPHNTAYSVKYLAPVAPLGDCLYLSIEQLLVHTSGCSPLTPCEIRSTAMKTFLQHYHSSSKEEQMKIDTTIKNLYYPDLSKGWGVSPIQTRRFIVSRDKKDELLARIYSLENSRRGRSWDRRAEMVYSEYATKVDNAINFAKYILVGSPKSDHFLVSMSYSSTGLVSVDDDQNNNKVSWGDDIVLEAIAAAYNRDIFVVLVGNGKMFFLPHRPRYAQSLSKTPGSNAPWFLLMRSTGADRGGDHYEPMVCQRLPGDACMTIGSIGD